MTTNDVINASLLTVGAAFAAEAIKLLQVNIWYAIAVAVVGTAILAVREILP